MFYGLKSWFEGVVFSVVSIFLAFLCFFCLDICSSMILMIDDSALC